MNTMMEIFVKLCGKLAPIMCIILYMAPIPTIYLVWKEKKVGDLPLVPYTSMICNTFVWVSYGLMREEPRVWIANGTGLVFGILYFIVFIYNSPAQSQTLPGTVNQHIQGASCLILLCLGIAKFLGPAMVGNLGIFLCVVMFASPLAALKVVLQTKSAKAIPLPFTIASVLNCLFWSISGLFDMNDYAIYAPNLLGLSFSLIQVLLKLVYRSERELRSDTSETRSLTLHEVHLK
mmetsp:Transcript_13139/g.20041  ORF Transcript_13139/g.20041 Transcript_13139/m.20041 type:complete len:234 (+) Transcript_13139:91-792(+)